MEPATIGNSDGIILGLRTDPENGVAVILGIGLVHVLVTNQQQHEKLHGAIGPEIPDDAALRALGLARRYWWPSLRWFASALAGSVSGFVFSQVVESARAENRIAKVFAWEGVPNTAWLNADFLSRHESNGVPLTIEAGSTKDIQVIAIPYR